MAEITYIKRVKIGGTVHEFQIKAENLHEAVKPLSFGNVDKCGVCGNTNLYLGAHVAKGRFKYTTIKCSKCKATLNFGQQQEDPDIYYLRTKLGQGGKKEYDWQPMTGANQQESYPPQGQAPGQSYPPQGQAPGQTQYYQNQQSYKNQGQ